MKVITPVHGTAIARMSSDEITPARGLLQRDLAAFVGDRYDFAVRPNASGEQLSDLAFQSGKLVAFGREAIPIQQLGMLSNGDVVTALTTDLADEVLTDLLAALEANMGYRTPLAPPERHYLSALVVQFDEPIEKIRSIFEKIAKVLDSAMPKNGPFRMKGLTFGGFTGPAASNLSEVERFDFTLQRRVGEPFELNRYYSSMPLPTARHAEVLEEIESILLG